MNAPQNGDSGFVHNGLPFYLIIASHSTKTTVSEILFSSYITLGCDVTSFNCLQYVTNIKKDENPAETG